MIINNNSPDMSFTSLKPQKRLGEAVLREFKQEMGSLKSSTNLLYRIDSLQDRGVIRPNSRLSKRIHEIADKMHGEIRDPFLREYVWDNMFLNYQNFKQQLVSNIKSKGNKANCWEDMMLIYTKLLEKGEKPHLLEIIVNMDNGRRSNHFTTVFGLKENAVLSNPKTWGTKALVVDAWVNVVEPAFDFLEKMKTKLLETDKLLSVEYSTMPPDYIKFVKPKAVKPKFGSILSHFFSC